MKWSVQAITATAALSATIALLMSSCTKETSQSSAEQQLSVYLSDDPVRYDSVFINIIKVEAKIDTGRSHMNDDHFDDDDSDDDDHGSRQDDYGTWVELNFTPGTYNVAALRNGIDTLLATGAVNGTVRKIRITLGTSNSVVYNGVTFPITLPNSSQPYLYIKLENEHRQRRGNSVSIWIDFDLSRSIVLNGNRFYLRPVLRPFCDDNFARLEGKVLPAEAKPVVVVYNSSDTASAIPFRNGEFKIRGLKEGTYSVWFKASNGYRDTTLLNVSVTKGRETKLPVVTLTQ